MKKTSKTTKTKAPASPFATLFDRWKAGEQISVLAGEANLKRSKLRKELTKLAGGKEKFRAMREQGAGGSAEPFGGKRASGGAQREEINDSKVKRIKHCRKADGWSWRGFDENMIHIAPDGTEYIRAKSYEKADLIVTHEEEKMQLTPSRFKLFHGSKEAKKAKREEKLIEQGQEAHKARRAKKREAKQGKRVKRKI